jgi:hypothetical protein
MKRLFLFFLGLMALVWVVAAPGEAPVQLYLQWDPPAGEAVQVDAHYIYYTTNLNTVGYVAGEHPYSYTNVPPKDAGWQLMASVPGDKYTSPITLPLGKAYFFVVTASNVWGETDFSNVAWTPELPSPLRQLRISREN